MNGSEYRSSIEAVAVLYWGFNRPKMAKKCLRSNQEHTVFEEECMRQVLGVELL